MVNKSDIELVGVAQCGPVAMHVTAIDSRITSLKINDSISSWMDIIIAPEAKHQLKNVVPGAMKYYDLPDLFDAIAPRSVKIIRAVDANGNVKNSNTTNKFNLKI
jgi:hypothetical protein